MSVTVDIDNNTVTLSDVATEATLTKLLDAFEKKNGGASPAMKAELKSKVDNIKANKDATIVIKGLKKSATDTGEALDGAAGAADNFASKGKRMLNWVLDSTKGLIDFGASTAGTGLNLQQLGTAIDKGSASFGSFGAVFGAAAGAIVGHSANLIDTFDGLSATGATFSNNLFDFERAAAKSYMTLEQMTSVLRSNSESLAAFGGSAKLGAARFMALNQVVQDTYRTEFAMMGIKASEAAELLANYTAMQARNTHFATMGVNQQAQAGANFVKQIQLLANLTGQDRKALSSKMANDKRRADVELALSRMQGEGADTARAAFTSMASQFGENSPIMDALRTSFLKLPAASTTAGNMLLNDANMGPVLKNITEGLQNGSMDLVGIQSQLAGVSSKFINANQGLEAVAQYSEIGMAFASISASLLNAQKQQLVVNEKYNGDYSAFVKASSADLDSNGKALKQVGLTINDVGKTVRLGFNSTTEGAVSLMAAGASKLKSLVDAMPKSLKELTDQVGGLEGPATTTTGAMVALSKAGNNVISAFNKMIKGLPIGSSATGASGATAVGLGAKTADTAIDASKTLVTKATGMMGTFLKVLPFIGATVTGVSAAANSERETTTGKVIEGGGAGLGALGGGMAGLKLGAMIGTAIFPGIGTAIGGLIGSVGGALIGEFAGKGVGSDIAGWLGFEDGGIVRQPTLAMVGEGKGGGDEAIIPLKNNRTVPVDLDMSSMNKMADAVGQLVKQQSGNTTNEALLAEMKKFNMNLKSVSRNLT